MHEYGMYIWPCYFSLLVVCVWNVFTAFKQRKQVMQKLRNVEIDNAAQSQA